MTKKEIFKKFNMKHICSSSSTCANCNKNTQDLIWIEDPNDCDSFYPLCEKCFCGEKEEILEKIEYCLKEIRSQVEKDYEKLYILSNIAEWQQYFIDDVYEDGEEDE